MILCMVFPCTVTCLCLVVVEMVVKTSNEQKKEEYSEFSIVLVFVCLVESCLSSLGCDRHFLIEE